MRILLITQGLSPVVMPLFRSHHTMVGIAEDGPRIPVSPFRKAKGTLVSSIYNHVNKNYQNLSQFCTMNEIPYFFIRDMRDPSFETWVRRQKPDLIVVYTMSHLLKTTIFSIPEHGAINLHPSYLPSYRGPNPYLWMYYHRDLTGGATVHYIDEGEDTGDIIFQEKITLTPGLPLHQLRIRLIDEVGTRLLLVAADAIEQGIAPRFPQPEESPTERARYLRNGEERILIDWKSWDVKRAWHLVHGYSGIYDFIGYLDPPPFGYRPVVHNYRECPVDEENRGKIGIHPDGTRDITCANGKIVYRFQWDLPRRVHNILQRLKFRN